MKLKDKRKMKKEIESMLSKQKKEKKNIKENRPNTKEIKIFIEERLMKLKDKRKMLKET